MADLKAALQSAAPSKENGSFPNWNNSEQTALVISTLTAEIQTLQVDMFQMFEVRKINEHKGRCVVSNLPFTLLMAEFPG